MAHFQARSTCLALLLTSFALLPTSDATAQTNACSVRAKIVGGEFARIADWPGQAAIRTYAKSADTSEYFCGGTAIAQRWVMTAAHCMHDYMKGVRSNFEGSGGKILAGRLQVVLRNDRLSKAPNKDVFDVEKVIIHPNYLKALKKVRDMPDPERAQIAEGRLAITTGDDIALLRLARGFRGRTARLSLNTATDPSTQPGQKVRVAGFGRTDIGIFSKSRNRYARSGGKGVFFAGSDRLKQATLFAIPTGVCSAHYSKGVSDGVFGQGQLCAGLEQGGEDSCSGDSGGPLVAYDQFECPYQVGLVSWGKKLCADGKSYGVYTRISQHASWIRQHVGALSGVANSGGRRSDVQISETDTMAAIQQLNALFGGRASKVDLYINDDNRIRVGERLVFRARSDISGRLVLIDINAKGEVLLIFPNKYVRSDDVGRIRRGEAINVPGRGYGFTAFRAVEPLGHSRMIALVVPEDFDIARFAANAGIRTKGFVPIKEPTSYLARFIRQIERYLIGTRRGGGNPLSNWAYSVTDYEIIR